MSKPQSVTAAYEDDATLHQETGATYTGAWTAATCGCYSGGTLKDSTAAGASASFRFTGDSIAFLSARGPSRGSFKVYIDGVYKATVSNYSSALQRAIIAWRGSVTNGTHTLKIVNQGTSGHPRIDVDAFIVGSGSSSWRRTWARHGDRQRSTSTACSGPVTNLRTVTQNAGHRIVIALA